MDTNIRVLLVDDEEKFVMNLARLLNFRGFDVSTALDGYKAIAILDKDLGFDVVILDVKMPGMNGITTLREIKNRSSEIKVIMLTGHATLESGIQSIREGAFDYLMKPCDIEDLTEKIKEACEVERIKRSPVLWPRNLIKEIKWPSFVKLKVTDPIEKALDVFTIRSDMTAREELYILDGQDRFKGIVTRKDLLEAAQKAHGDHPVSWTDLVRNPDLLPSGELGAIMRPDHPVTTDPEENLTQVAHRMIENNVRCMPVVKGERVKGFIRLQDIFHYVEHEIE